MEGTTLAFRAEPTCACLFTHALLRCSVHDVSDTKEEPYRTMTPPLYTQQHSLTIISQGPKHGTMFKVEPTPA